MVVVVGAPQMEGNVNFYTSLRNLWDKVYDGTPNPDVVVEQGNSFSLF